MARPRTIDRDGILDAVDTLLVENRGKSLTIDKVAQRAGVSKGGLIYIYPDRETLIEAALAREIARFRTATERHLPRGTLSGSTAEDLLRAFATESLNEDDASLGKLAYLVVALLDTPERLAPFRAFYDDLLAVLMQSGTRPEVSMRFFAIEGLSFLRAFQVARIPQDLWEKVIGDAGGPPSA
jgi:AcrR family transcriptional regulator